MTFRIVLTGVGGQGVITLTRIFAQSALNAGLDVKTSELHGLAQRGGHIECHVRLGKKVFSSLVREGGADLIIALEPLEALRACYYGFKKRTIFLVNSYKMPPLSVEVSGERYPSLKAIVKSLKKFSNRVYLIDASEKVRKETGSIVTTNVYMLGFASAKGLIPIKEKFLLDGIKDVVPERYFDINRKMFELAKKEV